MSLHDELARLADAAPPMAITRDPWEPAQRSRRRRSAAAIASAAVAIVLVAGLALWLPRGLPDPPVASTDALAVPDRIEAVPAHMGDRTGDDSWARDEVTDDLAIGRGAVAYVTRERLPVVIDAGTGAYHLLDLPGFLGNTFAAAYGLFGEGITVSLSPDGSQLAYGYAVFGLDAATAPIPSGVRVLDLVDGSVREIPIPIQEGTQVTRMHWSPGSRWLAWSGASLGSWTAGSAGRSTPVAGRIAPGATTSEPIEASWVRTERATTIDDNGVVTVVLPKRFIRWDGAPLGSTPYAGSGRPPTSVAVAPDGLSLLLGSCCTKDARTLATESGTVSTTRLPDLPGSLLDTTALGWLDDGTAVVQAMPQGGGGEGALVLVGADGSARDVGVLEDSAPDSISIAVDLMSSAQPTVARPSPDWPWSSERTWAVLGLGLLALLVAFYGWLVVRRPPAPRAPRAPRSDRSVSIVTGAVTIASLVAFQVLSGVSGLIGDDALFKLWVGIALLAVLSGVALLRASRFRAVGAGIVVGTLALVASEWLAGLLFLLSPLTS